jgi:N-acetyl-1-D-myo-inositol-2-amino-2-deoxy-alpha-D-glucopyranoside deacetylase
VTAFDDAPRRSLVAVVAHPDDEVLIAGGTLALAAAAGTPTAVVSLTRGERGPVAPGSLGPGETLAHARERELGAAADALGVGWARCLEHPDGALATQDLYAIGDEVGTLLREHEPAVLLTFDADGLYGHPDHLATRAVVALAAALLKPRPAMLESVWRAGLMAELVAAAAERDLPAGLWGLSPAAFGVERATSIEIDVRPVVARKLRALAAHRTQFAADHLLAALPADLAARFLGDEGWAADDPAAAGALRALLQPARP